MLRWFVALLLATGVAACGAPDPTGSLGPTASSPAPEPTAALGIGELRYACGGPPGFLPSDLDAPAGAELEDHPSAEALRAAIAEVGPDIDLLPESGYWLVARDAHSASYLARRPEGAEPPFVHATITLDGGTWRLAGWGDCRPTALVEPRSLATWVVDPEQPPPDAATTRITALVTELRCTGGQPMGGRLEPPVITYGVDSVALLFVARPLEGGGFDCPGNPPTRVVVELREPLGDRRLLDAGFFPPVEPFTPIF